MPSDSFVTDFLAECAPHYSVEVRDGLIERAVPAERTTLSIDGAEVPLSSDARILPGFVDTHCHLIGPGEMSGRVDLVGASSAEETLRRVEAFADERPGEGWLLGFGWNEASWPDRERLHISELDRLFPQRPVSLYRIDTHAVWCNSAALRQSGLERRADPVEKTLILRDEQGEPTGLVMEAAIKRMETGMPARTEEEYMAWYRYGAELCLKHGITEVHDMNVHPDWIEPLIRLAEAGELPIRVRVFLDGPRELWRDFGRPGEIAPNLHIDGVKFFADGALGSRGAWMMKPYADRPKERGVPTISADQLVELALEPFRGGFAVATHAIGDAANNLVLDAYERLRPHAPRGVLRIEHAQIVQPDDISRFTSLNILPAVQPIHCTSDIEMAETRLGTDLSAILYPWATFRRASRPLLAGSDFPVETPDVFAGIEAFVNREGPDGPWNPQERITAQEALAAYTSWAPLGVPDRPLRGRLQRGFGADLVVWSGGEAERVLVGGRVMG